MEKPYLPFREWLWIQGCVSFKKPAYFQREDLDDCHPNGVNHEKSDKKSEKSIQIAWGGYSKHFWFRFRNKLTSRTKPLATSSSDGLGSPDELVAISFGFVPEINLFSAKTACYNFIRWFWIAWRTCNKQFWLRSWNKLVLGQNRLLQLHQTILDRLTNL